MQELEGQSTSKELKTLKRDKIRQLIENKRKITKKTKFGIFFVITILIVGVIITAKNSKSSSSPKELTASLANIITEKDWTTGDENPEITIIEYGDLECEDCEDEISLPEKLKTDFENKIKFVYRNFPDAKNHPNSVEAAKAVEAAGLQGKFWEMRSLIIKNQSFWTKNQKPIDEFIKYAESLNLSAEQFREDLLSNNVQEKVARDYESGVQAGVKAYQTFFINKIKVEKEKDYDRLKTIIEKMLSEDIPSQIENN